MDWSVGDIVETAVFVGRERRPVGSGRIVAVYSGYCDVDIGYPHSAPWIVAYSDGELRRKENDTRRI